MHIYVHTYIYTHTQATESVNVAYVYMLRADHLVPDNQLFLVFTVFLAFCCISDIC